MGDKNLAKSTFPNCPEKVEMIESNLTVEIHRVRETASHIAFRERKSKKRLRIKWSRSTRAVMLGKSESLTMATCLLLDGCSI